MGLRAATVERRLQGLRLRVDQMLEASRAPGAAVAVVLGNETIYGEGMGVRDLATGEPMTCATRYPIASTSKAVNATLIGQLVEEGRLSWDAPVQTSLPGFRLKDPLALAAVSLRDLIAMRSGLPRHDWVWFDNPVSRREIVQRLRHLEPTVGFRARFQYSNLTPTVAGHVAEVVTGKSWEALAAERIFQPLGMADTTTGSPSDGPVTRSYRENPAGEIASYRRFDSEVTAPSGGAIHSTVRDMARWVALNLSGGACRHDALVSQDMLSEIQAPQVVVPRDLVAVLKPPVSYGLGWFVDHLGGELRLSHGGYLHDVDSSIMLIPALNLGVVVCCNFGPISLAPLIAETALGLAMAAELAPTLDSWLGRYEVAVAQQRGRAAAFSKEPCKGPSHDLPAYAGKFSHPAYGAFEVRCEGGALMLQRHSVLLELEHWHFDTWVAAVSDLYVAHAPHPFDRASPVGFSLSAAGRVVEMTLPLEPALPPVRFQRVQ